MVSSLFSARTTCAWHISTTFSFLGQTLASLTVYYHTSTDDLLRSPLTRSKSKVISFEDILNSGLNMLCTCIGPPNVREAFLAAKIDAEEKTQAPAQTPKPARVTDLTLLLSARPAPSATLFFTLQTWSTSGDAWTRLLRGSLDLYGDLDRFHPSGWPSTMPLSPCQPGWEEWVISHMGNVRPTPARPPTMPRTPCFTHSSRPSSPPDQVVSQGVRCRQMFGGQRSAIFRQPSDVEKLLVIQAGSAIGRRALSTLPLSPRYTLTGHEMRTAFHVRTLAQPISGLCRKCDQHNYFHGESCRVGNQARIGTKG